MRTLILGHSIASHAWARLYARSALDTEVFALPGNAGTEREKPCQNIAIQPDDRARIVSCIQTEGIQAVFLDLNTYTQDFIASLKSCVDSLHVVSFHSRTAPTRFDPCTNNPSVLRGTLVLHTPKRAFEIAHTTTTVYGDVAYTSDISPSSGALWKHPHSPQHADLHIGLWQHHSEDIKHIPCPEISFAALVAAHRSTWENDLAISLLERDAQDLAYRSGISALRYGSAARAVCTKGADRELYFKGIPSALDEESLWGASRRWHTTRVVSSTSPMCWVGSGESPHEAYTTRTQKCDMFSPHIAPLKVWV